MQINNIFGSINSFFLPFSLVHAPERLVTHTLSRANSDETETSSATVNADTKEPGVKSVPQDTPEIRLPHNLVANLTPTVIPTELSQPHPMVDASVVRALKAGTVTSVAMDRSTCIKPVA